MLDTKGFLASLSYLAGQAGALPLQELEMRLAPAEEQGFVELDRKSTSLLPAEVAPFSLAICLAGQSARLELQTKASRILAPNTRSGTHVGLFMVLQQGSGRYVNDILKGDAGRFQWVDGPYTNHSATQLKQTVAELTARAGGDTARLHTYVKMVPRTHYIPDPNYLSRPHPMHPPCSFGILRV